MINLHLQSCMKCACTSRITLLVCDHTDLNTLYENESDKNLFEVNSTLLEKVNRKLNKLKVGKVQMM